MAGNFCHSKVELWRDDLPTDRMREASGLCVSSSSKFLYVVNDSPEAEPYIFVFEKATMKRCIIEITGIRATGFNSNRHGVGYGDWEAVELVRDQDDTSKRYIIVADIGHNKVRRKGGKMRTADQQTRLILVPEPTDEQLSKAVDNSGTLHVRGTEHPIQYSKANRSYDAEAMTVLGESIIIITKNTKRNKKSFVFQTSIGALKRAGKTTLTCIGQMRIQFSEVTDAFCTSKLLGIRTYNAINFYAWDDFHPGSDTHSRGYHTTHEIKRTDGMQEAAAYDPSAKKIYLLGEGAKKIFVLNFNAEAKTQNWSGGTEVDSPVHIVPTHQHFNTSWRKWASIPATLSEPPPPPELSPLQKLLRCIR